MIAFLTFLVVIGFIVMIILSLWRNGAFDNKEVRMWKFFIRRAEEFVHNPEEDGLYRHYVWTNPDNPNDRVTAVVFSNGGCSLFERKLRRGGKGGTRWEDGDCILSGYRETYSREMAQRLIRYAREFKEAE